ncbi:cytochrome P450 [Astrocystis sublimbata]|nr:cytochrome P450 [Astrocystis sublimbata]
MAISFSSRVGQLISQEPSLAAWRLACVLAALYLVYCIGLAVYRLTFHPLAKIPGPFLCRISYLPQAYYEAILQGKFIHEIPKYHVKYGPVVRLSPHEVHVNDITVFHEVFNRNRGFTKDPVTYSVGSNNAMTMTIPVEAHRAKRQVLDPVFSKRRINNMEGSIYDEIDRIFEKVEAFRNNGEQVPIHELLYCYTADIVSELLFGRSLDMVSAPDFRNKVKDMQFFTSGVWVALHFTFLRQLITDGPRWFAQYLSATYIRMITYFEELAKEALANYDSDKASQKEKHEETIFDRMVTNNHRRREKDPAVKPLEFRDLADESAMILNGGTEPPANQMAYAVYHFLKYPHVQKQILGELATVEPDESGRLPLRKVENLPYFTSFVKESLRHATLIPGRLPRRIPKGGLHVPSANVTIPEGYAVGISHDLIHKDPGIFPEPYEFHPERWLGPSGKELLHWLVSFSWGRTDCIGKNLAWAEMYLMLANLFSRYDLELADGAHEAMQWGDRVIMHPHGFLHVKAKTRAAKVMR